ncbi:hypothetical protein Ddye_016212 [Dipteronia dyeriana]|uniref:Uncharacterized protein n=1 Tax=Dipteronia dyeriana TaxID=168575 RepID=A0AAD9WZW7_9ROSI|nr:hypothetical protein Ddye_016212 [Dipteronia dyeriana]
MFGAIPAALTFYWRMKIPETAALAAMNVKQTCLSQNMYQKTCLLFSAIGRIPPAKIMNAVEEFYGIARTQRLIAVCSTVSDYWFTRQVVVTAEIFPARFRSTCHGISVSMWEPWVGAIVGVFGFLYLAQKSEPGQGRYKVPCRYWGE